MVGAAHAVARLNGGRVLAEVGVEAAREEQRAARDVEHLGAVVAGRAAVDEVDAAAGPDSLPVDLVEGGQLLLGVSGVHVVDAQRRVDELRVEGGEIGGQDGHGQEQSEGGDGGEAAHGVLPPRMVAQPEARSATVVTDGPAPHGWPSSGGGP